MSEGDTQLDHAEDIPLSVDTGVFTQGRHDIGSNSDFNKSRKPQSTVHMPSPLPQLRSNSRLVSDVCDTVNTTFSNRYEQQPQLFVGTSMSRYLI
jgi:hypothetical protein